MEFYFLDWNYPEVIYRGTQEDMDYIRDNGGDPRPWDGPTGPLGAFIEVQTSMGTERLEVVRPRKNS